MASPILTASSAVARAVRKGDKNAEHAARLNLAEVRIEQAIRDVLAAAPAPLRPDQCERLAALLLNGGE